MVILLGMLWLMPKALLPTAFDGTSKSPSAALALYRPCDNLLLRIIRKRWDLQNWHQTVIVFAEFQFVVIFVFHPERLQPP